MARFSKKCMVEILERKIEYLEREHGFVSGNGWSQVDNKGESINRAYGEYIALYNLLNELED